MKSCLSFFFYHSISYKLKALKAEDYVVNHSSAAGGELLKKYHAEPFA
jgi:hypothetical protein